MARSCACSALGVAAIFAWESPGIFALTAVLAPSGSGKSTLLNAEQCDRIVEIVDGRITSERRTH